MIGIQNINNLCDNYLHFLNKSGHYSDYIKKFDGLCPDTFLYFEEDILRLYSKSYNFLMMYTSDISIYHKEDVASIAMNPKPLQKKLFVYKNRLKSAKVYKKVYKSLMKKVK
jgi:hypothetical protein